MTAISPRTLAYLSLGAICIIWGTTYTGIKLAIRDFPPFLLVGLRQILGGLVLLALAWAMGRFQVPGWAYTGRQMFMGLLTITGGNGLITWGMQYVSSGLSSVIGSLTPVVVVLINILWRGGEPVSLRVVAGVLIGFLGLGVVFHDGWQDFLDPRYRWGIVAAFGSCFTWSLGTVMAKRYNAPGVSPVLNAGLQVLFGGLFALPLHFLLDPVQPVRHTTEGWVAVLYLAFIGSAVAFSLYMFALQHLSAAVSSLYTYINPVVAITMGWLFLDERLSPTAIAGMAVTIFGVWLVNSGIRVEWRKRMIYGVFKKKAP
ncbi:MAG: EamA family transporter [Saprospiraceae bacterium]|nr:EamA family transporter [Saprospiraceae bacterium]